MLKSSTHKRAWQVHQRLSWPRYSDADNEINEAGVLSLVGTLRLNNSTLKSIDLSGVQAPEWFRRPTDPFCDLLLGCRNGSIGNRPSTAEPRTSTDNAQATHVR